MTLHAYRARRDEIGQYCGGGESGPRALRAAGLPPDGNYGNLNTAHQPLRTGRTGPPPRGTAVIANPFKYCPGSSLPAAPRAAAYCLPQHANEEMNHFDRDAVSSPCLRYSAFLLSSPLLFPLVCVWDLANGCRTFPPTRIAVLVTE